MIGKQKTKNKKQKIQYKELIGEGWTFLLVIKLPNEKLSDEIISVNHVEPTEGNIRVGAR